MDIDWQRLSLVPTPEIIQRQMISGDQGAGILWSTRIGDIRELSACGALAWEGHEDKPPGPLYEWVGFNLLCNAAPTPFVLNGETFHSIDSFHEALKIPEGSAARAACAVSALHEARRIARRFRLAEFSYRGVRVAAGSAGHEAILAAAIAAKIDQHPEVQTALRETGLSRLVFPLTFSARPGALARATPLTLMLERWKRFDRRLRHPGGSAAVE